MASEASEMLRFAQEELDKKYKEVYKKLYSWKDSIHLIQEVLTWKKPLFSLVLYIGIHWLFYQLAVGDDGALSILTKIAIVLLIGDILWQMTRAKQVKNERSTLSARLRRNSKLPYVSLEDALIESNSQRPLGTLRSYPHLVLLVAQAWLWADMFLVSLRVKITERSSHLAVVFIVVGFVVSQTAQLIPGIVLSYIFVVGVLTWPYIECYHALDSFIERVSPWYQKIDWSHIKQKLVRPEEEEEYEFAIDEHFTKEAFAMAISGKYIPKRQRRSSRSASAEPRDTPTMNEENPTIYEEQRTSKSRERSHSPAFDPASMSLDPQYDSLVADLAYGLEEMPSISSDLTTIEEFDQESTDNLPDLASAKYNMPRQGRRPKKRHLPLLPMNKKGDVKEAGNKGYPYPELTPSPKDHMTSTPVPSDQLPSDQPPCYEDVLQMEGENVALFYQQQRRQ